MRPGFGRLTGVLPGGMTAVNSGSESQVLNYDAVMGWAFADVVQTYSKRDTILYALGLGVGENPLDEDQLRYTYEKHLVAVPTYPVVLGNPGPWMSDPRTGIDWVKSLHGEQGLVIFKPIPVEGTVIGRNRVVDVTVVKEMP